MLVEFSAFVVLTYLVGAFVSAFVYRVRAGLGFWYGVRLFGDGGVGLGWAALTIAKLFAWPVVLGVWLAGGRPEPSIVFNDKAIARRRAMTSA